jgi:DNA-binding NarL/FixJ family response regulator
VIRLLIAAPSTILRAGLEAFAASSPGVELVGSFPDLTSVDALRPDVVLTTFAPDEIALEDGAPATYVLLTDTPHPTWTQEAVRTGVRAILPNNASPGSVLAAVEAAASGLAAVDPRDLEPLLSPASAAPLSADPPALTTRELEVFRMLAEGAANKTIAWKLNISEHTVKFHVASILSKLNASTRTEAVTRGVRTGLILL